MITILYKYLLSTLPHHTSNDITRSFVANVAATLLFTFENVLQKLMNPILLRHCNIGFMRAITSLKICYDANRCHHEKEGSASHFANMLRT